MAVTLLCARCIIAGTITKRLTFSAFRAVQETRHFANTQYAYFPETPKRPSGAFIHFLKERRTEIRKNNPGCSLMEKEVSKIASQLWGDLDPEQQNVYKLRAKEELQDYKQKYSMFLDGLSEQEKSQIKDNKRAKRASRQRLRQRQEWKRLGKPKKSPNAYMLFVQSSLLERGNMPIKQFIKSLADYWQSMPSEEKEIYQEDARAEKEKYLKEMEEWEKRMREIGREDVIRKYSGSRPQTTVGTKAGKTFSPTGRKQKQASASSRSQGKITKKLPVSEESESGF